MKKYFILLASLCTYFCSTFNPDHVYLMDTRSSGSQHNFLFRGNIPFDSHMTFQYDALVKCVKDKISKAGKSLNTKNFKIVDISLLSTSSSTESKWIEAEKAYFKKYPEKGQFYRWHVHGVSTSPSGLSDSKRKSKLKSIWQDDYPDLPHNLYKLMTSFDKHGADLVFYFHCKCGKDRTGQVAGSWYMERQGYTYQKALDLDNKLSDHRSIDDYRRHGLRWYCYQMKFYISGFSSQDCNEYNNMYNNISITTQFNSDDVYLVDALSNGIKTNVLFAGSVPLDSNLNLAWDSLTSTFAKKASQENAQLKPNFKVVDISLVNDIVDQKYIDAEREYFAKNPAKGEFIHWMVMGATSSPSIYPKDFKQIAVNTIWLDKFPEFVQTLVKKLYTFDSEDDRDVVYYIHGLDSLDNTGQAAGAYYMQIKGYNFEDALTKVEMLSNEERDISYMNRWGLRWYCYYLKQNVEEFKEIDCEDRFEGFLQDLEMK